jgi:RHS repeat-associated protein
MKPALQVFCALVLIGSSPCKGLAAKVSTTVYVGRHFEIRDRDQPVKYVSYGANRIARITGSLAATDRVQQLRLYQGWNLISVAISVTNAAQQISNGGVVDSAYLWNSTSRSFDPLSASESLPAGSILWLKASNDGVLKLFGSYTDPLGYSVAATGGYGPSMGLENWSFTPPASATVWNRDGATHAWQPTFGSPLKLSAQPKPVIAPGEAIYIETEEPLVLTPPEPAFRIGYYHPDHLGSAAIMTDATGALIEESCYFPYGAKRNVQAVRDFDASYGFLQKELDDESHLQYFGHRYLAPALGKWLSTDPLGESGGGPNPYVYADNNPLKLVDRDGSEIKISGSVSGDTITYHIELKAVLIDASSTKIDQQKLAAYGAKLQAQIESSFKGAHKGTVQISKTKAKMMNFVWDTKVTLRVVSDWSQVENNDHVFRIVDQTSTRASGDSKRGGMLISIARSVLDRPPPDQWGKVPGPGKGLTWADYHTPEAVGAHEFGHTAGLPHQNTKENLMTEGEVQNYRNVNTDLGQLRKMVEAYDNKQVNQRDPLLESITKKK